MRWAPPACVGGGVADRDEVTLLGDHDNLREGAEERIGARDHVVSCEGANNGIGVTLGKDLSHESNCGHGVFGSRLVT